MITMMLCEWCVGWRDAWVWRGVVTCEGAAVVAVAVVTVAAEVVCGGARWCLVVWDGAWW